LENARLVDDQHRPRIAQVLQHLPTQVVAHRVRVPLGAGQQALHAVGPRLARMLGELPPVLALNGAEQSIDLPPHPRARLRARQARPDALLNLVPPRAPGSDFRPGEFLPAPLLLHGQTPFGFRSSSHITPLTATVKLGRVCTFTTTSGWRR